MIFSRMGLAEWGFSRMGLTKMRPTFILRGSSIIAGLVLTLGFYMELSGAEITIKCLEAEGVEYVFGYPGGAVLFIYDALFNQDKVKHILVRHEQGAVHAADGYARSTDKVA